MFFNAKQYTDYLNSSPAHASTRAHVKAAAGTLTTADFTNDTYDGPRPSRNASLVTEEEAQIFLNQVSDALHKRQTSFDLRTKVGNTYIRWGHYLGKWTRPWTVVPELRDFTPPKGEYGIGVEIELGFSTLDDAEFVAEHLLKYDNVALDMEGGSHPIEATFPPILLSNLDSYIALDYLKFLQQNEERVAKHHPTSIVGTHVNVSCGNPRPKVFSSRLGNVNDTLQHYLTSAQKNKFFGRIPYGYGFWHGSEDHSFIEWKLFNSQIDPEVLRRYIRIAVALTDIVWNGNTDYEKTVNPHERADVLVAILEKAYVGEQPANVSEEPAEPAPTRTTTRRRRAA